MIICGDVETVEELQLKIKTGLFTIYEATIQLKQSLYEVKDKWQDEGYSEIENCILQVMESMTSYMGDFDILYSMLEKYKHILQDDEWSNINAFKNHISDINSILQQYKEELMARGVVDGAAIKTVLSYYRHQYQAALIGKMNGQYIVQPTEPDFNELAQSMKKDGKVHYMNSLSPRKLSQTRYGFQDIVFNGKQMEVYDDPIGTWNLLIHKQGNSQYPMKGTCGLCQCANILTMAGVPTTEEDMISIALHASDSVLKSMELFNEESVERGGTTVRNRKELLESQGVEMVELAIDPCKENTIKKLENAVISGRGVILSVDVERLWKNGQSGGHAISLLSVTSDGSTFIYSDTGMGIIGMISAEDLAKALTGRPANITKNVIR